MNANPPSLPDPTAQEVATFAGGCFWCLEAAFDALRGVSNVVSGYAGGATVSPTYEQVCTGRTGHAEVVQVTFDPRVISYEDLLGVFFSVHDPTTLNRQGADMGTQYRSAIYYHDEAQKETARRVMVELQRQGTWSGIVTELEPLEAFYPAEEYHRDYYARNERAGYCRAVIAPKLDKLRKRHAELLKA